MDETHGLRCDVLQIAPNFAPNIRSGVITPYTGCLAAPGVSSPETLRPAGAGHGCRLRRHDDRAAVTAPAVELPGR